jgi:hypothetical protein
MSIEEAEGIVKQSFRDQELNTLEVLVETHVKMLPKKIITSPLGAGSRVMEF